MKLHIAGTKSAAFHWSRSRAGILAGSFAIALGTLWSHKLRSTLTIFGIVIGIAAVALIGTTLEFVRAMAVKSTTQTIGADTFVLAQVASVGNLSRKELSEKLRKHPKVYRGEAEAFAQRIADAALTAPSLDQVADVKSGNRLFQSATVNGSTANVQIIRNIELSSGRFFTEAENRRSAGVAILGQDLVDEFYPAVDPLGKSIRIRGRLFQVIGVQKKQGSSFGSSLDRTVYIPLRTFEKIWGSRRSVNVLVQPVQPAALEEVRELSRAEMRALRRLRPAAPDNFDLLIPEAGQDFLMRLVSIVSIAIVPISSVALIVSGIVVMNMMLVSVTERTRETGIRKSLGARNRDIFAEILFESAILTVFGGMAGLLIAWCGTLALSRAFGETVRLAPVYVFQALGLAAAVGLAQDFSRPISPRAWLLSRRCATKADMRPVHFNRETLSLALSNILAFRFRSFLTVLGIIVGIVTVVLVASVLVGVRRNLALLFQEFGPDNIFAYHLDGDPGSATIKPEELSRKPLKAEFAGALMKSCPSLKAVAVQILVPNVVDGRAITARHGPSENENIQLQGATWDFAQVTNAELQEGRTYSYEEERRRARVCLLGANVAASLFPSGGAIARSVVVDGAIYRVVGVFEKRKGGFFGENRQDNVVMIPLSTARMRYPDADTVVLYCQAAPGLREAALLEVEAGLRALRKLSPGDESDFKLSTSDSIIRQLDRITLLVQTGTIAISGLGLLVGGVGVMNIMLMSVTQRTREIGVRKALGARRKDIVWQFLLEAALLTTIGGILGVSVAAILGLGLAWFVPNLPAVPPAWAVVSGLVVSTGVGLLFGIWPAVKAARLDPVEALRYE